MGSIATAKKAPAIRALAERYPEMSRSAIARKVGCTPAHVTGVLKDYLKGTSLESLREYQEHQADILDAISHRLLSSLTPAKIAKASALQAMTAGAIAIDKARLVRGQATGINVSVLMDVAESIRSMRDQPKPQVIDSE